MRMTRLKLPTTTMSEAKAWANKIDALSDVEFQSLLQQWGAHQVEDFNPDLNALRGTCVDAFERAGGRSLPARKMYPIDVEVGLALYTHLINHEFTPADAANDDVWRYISIKVVPDLTYFRYPDPEKQAKEQGCRINKKRFFSHTRRIWIKTLWWYVHLSWQGDSEKTRSAIEENGSNIISHFIETPGKGYRVDVYRELMRLYSINPDKKDKLFRSVAKLNGAECRNIEPALMPGGVGEYCSILFNKVRIHEDNDD